MLQTNEDALKVALNGGGKVGIKLLFFSRKPKNFFFILLILITITVGANLHFYPPIFIFDYDREFYPD